MKIIGIASAGKLEYYLEDMLSFLRRKNVTAGLYPLSQLNKSLRFFWKNDWDKRHINLERLVRTEKPNVLIFNSSSPRFDFPRIRSFFKGKIVVYDMEGPNFPGFRDPSWIPSVDAVVTVSAYSRDQLREAGYKNVFYIPHGVNIKRFVPRPVPVEDERFFIGRPAPHRTACFSFLAEQGFPVRLYGRKWHEMPDLPDSLKPCLSPIQSNIGGDQLLERIAAGRIFVNALQDHYVDLHTLINMQAFFVTACRRCVITEFVDEIPDIFEPDREILVYRTLDELLDKVRFCHDHPDYVDSISEAAYQRTIKCHTMQQRSESLFNLILSL